MSFKAPGCYTIIAPAAAGADAVQLKDLKLALEKNDERAKIEAMKRVLGLMLAGERCDDVLMHVIRFVMPSKNKFLKKLLLQFWELCPKRDAEGKLKQEMILVCNALRNDLNHANEFVRGSTLRYLIKLRESEVLEPLISSVKANLKHRHFYVRKYAMQAIAAIHSHSKALLPDVEELILEHLQTETNPSCRRSFFVALVEVDAKSAVEYFLKVADQLSGYDELFQLAVLDLIRRDTKSKAANKATYITCVASLLTSSSSAVRYESAAILTLLTKAPTAIKEVAKSYIELVVKDSDNNIKLITLERLLDLQAHHGSIFEDLSMDVTRILTSSDIEVRRKCLQILLQSVTTRNVTEIVGHLSKELTKTEHQTYEKNDEYRQLLIETIHVCALNHHAVAKSALVLLLTFLGDSNSSSAADALKFVREAIQKIPELRAYIIGRLIESLTLIKSGKVLRGCLWILGEFAVEVEDIVACFDGFKVVLGEYPFDGPQASAGDAQAPSGPAAAVVDPLGSPAAAPAGRKVLADGTYATESGFMAKGNAHGRSAELHGVFANSKTPLRTLFFGGDYFLASSLATTLLKLVTYASRKASQSLYNALRADALLILVSILGISREKLSAHLIDGDSFTKIVTVIRLLSAESEAGAAPQGNGDLVQTFISDSNRIFTQLTNDVWNRKQKTKAAEPAKFSAFLKFRQFTETAGSGAGAEIEADNLSKDISFLDTTVDAENKLNKLVQLTGFSDPLYVEAFVVVHQFDIFLDILVVNQTPETLQNVGIDFSTLGDLKLVDRPSVTTMGPYSFNKVKANLKVASTESGVIFGNVVYESKDNLENCVVLNDIHIDIMEYIKPAVCTELKFRAMWTEFEWENKVNVNTNITSLTEFLEHIKKCTNMAVLTSEEQLSGDCGYLAANMYAKSVFGEDALANISLELTPENVVVGSVRIRSKAQGIALSLGDQITLKQNKRAV